MEALKTGSRGLGSTKLLPKSKIAMTHFVLGFSADALPRCKSDSPLPALP